MIQAIRLQYRAGIMDYFRWAVTLSLPFRCLVDICGVQYADYVQATWDDAVRAIICKETPIHMVDVDGREYDVRVETASRRASGVFWDVPTNKKQQDIAWSLTLIQVCPDSLCEV